MSSPELSPTDLYLSDELLTDEERRIRDVLHEFCAREVTPIINDYWERAEFPFELVPKIAGLGLAGGVITGYGCPGMTRDRGRPREHGVGARGRQHRDVLRRPLEPRDAVDRHARLRRAEGALARADGATSTRSARSASPSPSTARTPSRWRRRARRDGDDWVLDGRKRWIGNGSIADVVLIWARREDGHVGGFLVEKGTPGFDARVMTGKTALRAVWQADITLDGVRVPDANRLPGCERFARRRAGPDRHALHGRLARARRRARRLRARAGLRVGARAVRPARSSPTSSSRTSSAGWRPRSRPCSSSACASARSQEEGRLTSAMASLAKMNHAAKARQVVGRRPRHPRRERDPAREPRRAPPRRHGGGLHVRGDRLDPVADRRPGAHRGVGDRAPAGVLTGAISGLHGSVSRTSCLLRAGCVQPCMHAQVRPQDAVRPPVDRARAGRPVRRRGAAQRAGGLAGRPLAAPAPGCLARSALSPHRPRPAPRSSPPRAPDAGPVSCFRPAGDRAATVGGCGIGRAPRHLGR